VCGIVTRGTDATFGYFGPRLSASGHENYKRLYNRGFISNSGGGSAIDQYTSLTPFEQANLGTKNAYLIVVGGCGGGVQSMGLDLTNPSVASALRGFLSGGSADPLLGLTMPCADQSQLESAVLQIDGPNGREERPLLPAKSGATAEAPAQAPVAATPEPSAREEEFIGQLVPDLEKAVQGYLARCPKGTSSSGVAEAMEVEARTFYREKMSRGNVGYQPAAVAWLKTSFQAFSAVLSSEGGQMTPRAREEYDRLQRRSTLASYMVSHYLRDLHLEIARIESATSKLVAGKL
jgi:hypothetical protein